MKILLVADNCSKKMGGEAILPYHYFRILKEKKVDVKLLVHERNKSELEELFGEYKSDIYFMKDTFAQKMCWKIGSKIPKKIADATFFSFSFLSSNFRMKRTAKKIIKENKIDVVHQVTPVAPKAPSFLYRINVPVIIGPMNGGMEYPPEFRKEINLIEKIFHRFGKRFGRIINLLIPGKNKAALLIAANERTVESIKAVVKDKRIEIEHENGVDLKIWDKINRKNMDVTDEAIFTFVGRLEDWKGVHFLLKSMKIVNKTNNIKLNIIGDGIERESLERLAKELEIKEKVDFIGFLPQGKIPEILVKSRALVLPSIYECGGAVVLEAMALEKAVIATNWGGPSEYIDNSCGILVSPYSEKTLIEGFATAMIKLAENKELADTMGANGRRKVEENFDWDKKAEKIINYYKMVIENNKQV